ncbi:MAG: 16S rRNA (guanine(527)-N(7))-methyltransferase RsmG [Pseudomonadota bacterium]
MTPEDFAAAANVSRETLHRLKEMDRVLIDWSARHNLIARSTIEERWRRHYLDSAQVFALLPADAATLVDLGSGAGFPGLVLAAMGAEKKLAVTLIESTGKKAAFLREAGAAMALPALKVIPERIEKVGLDGPPDIVTARALARLEKLLGYAHGIGGENTKYFFFKGQDVEAEIAESSTSWQMTVKRHKSISSPDGTILEIGNLSRV